MQVQPNKCNNLHQFCSQNLSCLFFGKCYNLYCPIGPLKPSPMQFWLCLGRGKEGTSNQLTFISDRCAACFVGLVFCVAFFPLFLPFHITQSVKVYSGSTPLSLLCNVGHLLASTSQDKTCQCQIDQTPSFCRSNGNHQIPRMCCSNLVCSSLW